MTPDEITEFLSSRRTMTLATVGADGQPHLVAMWYGLIDGDVVFSSYRNTQKVKNLERNPRVTVLVEEGETYPELRGVQIAGRAELVDDPETVSAIGQSIGARYTAKTPAPDARTTAAASAAKRIGIRVKADKVATWDHRKLGGAD